LLLSILAAVSAAFLPLAASSQIIHHRGAERPEQAELSTKYEVYAGFGYTSLNQVNQSRYGLEGVDLSVTRDWGKHFGLIAEGAVYSGTLQSGSSPNPGNPSVDAVLFGPVVRADLFKHFDGFFRVLLGGEHTAGENARPNVAFARGIGVGLDRQLSPHFAVRASGDDIGTAFAAGTPALPSEYSPHTRYNAHASVGVVYRF
jgi:hypothetical protein